MENTGNLKELGEPRRQLKSPQTTGYILPKRTVQQQQRPISNGRPRRKHFVSAKTFVPKENQSFISIFSKFQKAEMKFADVVGA
jgi:hypothetical protein